jgi:hypothetical protein
VNWFHKLFGTTALMGGLEPELQTAHAECIVKESFSGRISINTIFEEKI